MQSARSKCLLEKAAEAILYQIFSLLTAREHWNLSTTSHKLKTISCHPHASPTQVEILSTTEAKVVQHLLTLLPQSLTLPFNMRMISNEHDDYDKLPKPNQVRELTWTRNNGFPITNRNMGWFSQLTNLTKLKIPDAHFNDLTSLSLLPASLTHLHVPGIAVTGFPYVDGLVYRLSNCHSLPALQVLKLPKNRYYTLNILGIGTAFPQLRELCFGYFGRNQAANHWPFGVNLTALQSCTNLESLSIGLDSDEIIPRWETLAPITSLRRLTVTIFPRELSSTLFAGLDKVSQLTYLKLVPHQSYRRTDISPAIAGLATRHETTSAPNAQEKVPVDDSILPQLSSLLIDDAFQLPNATSLSIFTSLTELQLPTSTLRFPDVRHFPLLRTLHTVGGLAIRHYKDRVEEIVYNQSSFTADSTQIIQILPKMKQLKTLRLHPLCALPTSTGSGVPIANIFRSSLPPTLPTVQIEIDNSIEDELYSLG